MGLAFLIDRPGYRLATDRKVLKRNEAAVIEEITQAYVRAQGEINSALANLEKTCTKATEDAYRKGLAKAEQEAARHWTLVEVERLMLLRSMQPALAELIARSGLLVGSGHRPPGFFGSRSGVAAEFAADGELGAAPGTTGNGASGGSGAERFRQIDRTRPAGPGGGG